MKLKATSRYLMLCTTRKARFTVDTFTEMFTDSVNICEKKLNTRSHVTQTKLIQYGVSNNKGRGLKWTININIKTPINTHSVDKCTILQFHSLSREGT